jgi:hypothetical protein
VHRAHDLPQHPGVWFDPEFRRSQTCRKDRAELLGGYEASAGGSFRGQCARLTACWGVLGVGMHPHSPEAAHPARRSGVGSLARKLGPHVPSGGLGRAGESRRGLQSPQCELGVVDPSKQAKDGNQGRLKRHCLWVWTGSDVQVPGAMKPLLAATVSNLLIAAPSHAGVLFDFNLTLPIIAGQFLALMFVLDKLIYTPVGEVLDKRDGELRSKLAAVKDNSGELSKLAVSVQAAWIVPRPATRWAR